MIQLNLLPDVKSKYITTERTKHLTIVSAMAACGLMVGVVLILVGVTFGAQKAKLSNLDSSIIASGAQLKNIDGLNKILTIQNQLNSLTTLHSQKPVTSRLFNFLPQLTPTNVNISDITIRYEDSSIAVNGTATSLEAVNKFVDTLKFTEYTTEQSETSTPAFSSVVLVSFNKTDTEVNYSITAFFDPLIFSNDYTTITLVVPSITSTRSQTEQPDLLFQEQPESSTEESTNDLEEGVQ
jgi:Tfp pilus assembly protein PilN